MKLLEGDTIKTYFIKEAQEKARITNIKVNEYKATAVFKEYEAPEELKEEFQKLDNSDGHFYYITFYIWTGKVKSHWTNKDISIKYDFLTTKNEGNAIYKQIKANGEITIDIDI